MSGSILVIDAGNSRIKWGTHDGNQWIKLSSLENSRAAELKSCFAQLPSVQMVVVSNVAGELLRGQLAAVLPANPTPRWIKSVSAQCGVRNGYADPAQLGCDRWAALIGALRLAGGPALVVNAGTALTVDALTAAGEFLGGIIVPGAELMCQALAAGTAALRFQPGRFGRFPTATGDAILSGAIDAMCGAIERMARFLDVAGQAAPRCVLSGGGAPLLAPHLNLEVKVVDNLVLEGLLVIAREG